MATVLGEGFRPRLDAPDRPALSPMDELLVAITLLYLLASEALKRVMFGRLAPAAGAAG